jgi:hypothetical protein
MFKKIGILVLVFLLSGCAAITGEIKQAVGNDLTRTSELADKYGKPDVKLCADFLNTSLNSQDSTLGKIDALLAEPTAGLLSGALKAALVAELVKSLNDPAAQAKLEKEFDTNCRAVAGQIMLNLARDARKGLTRGIGR